MSDPVRRDPTEFLRALRRMANTSTWQKSMLFASKGRMIGYRMTVEHYNTVLFSQSMWGRALEIARVIKAMQYDKIQPNGATYYYICNGMGNVEHGWNYDFNINKQLPRLQHWRIAIEALSAAQSNGFDTTDTMHNSCIISCVIPGIGQWKKACYLLNDMIENDKKMHSAMVRTFHDSLIRHMRPKEASLLLRLASENEVEGYRNAWEMDIFGDKDDKELTQSLTVKPQDIWKQKRLMELNHEESKEIEENQRLPVPYSGSLHPMEMNSVFRPRVHRFLKYHWNSIANRYRSSRALKKKQLSGRDSPSGIPGFSRL